MKSYKISTDELKNVRRYYGANYVNIAEVDENAYVFIRNSEFILRVSSKLSFYLRHYYEDYLKDIEQQKNCLLEERAKETDTRKKQEITNSIKKYNDLISRCNSGYSDYSYIAYPIKIKDYFYLLSIDKKLEEKFGRYPIAKILENNVRDKENTIISVQYPKETVLTLDFNFRVEDFEKFEEVGTNEEVKENKTSQNLTKKR